MLERWEVLLTTLDLLSSSVLDSFSSTESRGLTTVDGVVLDTGISISGNNACSVPGPYVASAASLGGIAKEILLGVTSSVASLLFRLK